MANLPEGKIAFSLDVLKYVNTKRETVAIGNTNFTDISAVVLSEKDIDAGLLDHICALGFGIPIFAVSDEDPNTTSKIKGLSGVIARHTSKR